MSNPGKTFVIEGERLTVAQIAKRAGITGAAVRRRVQLGIRGKALLEPKSNANPWLKRPRLVYDVGEGRRLTASEIAALAGVERRTITERIRQGVRGPELLRKPAQRLVPVSSETLTLLDGYATSRGVSREDAFALAVQALLRTVDD